MRNKRAWIVPALTVLLAALAFYLPPQLSRWDDRQLMDDPRILQVEEGEGLAESLRLTAAEKLMLLRGGSLSFLALTGEEAEIRYILQDGEGGAYISSEPEVGEPAGDSEEWAARLAAVKRELLALQRAGGLPELWTEASGPELLDGGEILYIDSSTQVNFLVYHMELSAPDWGAGVTVDEQTGKLLSLSLRWSREAPPSWGASGAAGFGGAWRDYWGMDSVDPGWNSARVNDILASAQAFSNSGGDSSGAGEVVFTYDGQTLRVPLYGWCSAGVCAVQWNM